ncbi:MAG: aminomethyl-transferring glycine dehydrogenase subunit GcvPA [Pirellulaceae bacterium]|jgi:glycine dehydrogenase subunit 1|nr:aminomethyl-transferring glycine dehydrogenase subunit GcvPA [Pirellulaceae bacterium]MDP7017573.1 aminomethyl-transferring glycine dehydrogenase subunit GcvPA [Pirellulaceae bacterium]
MPYLFNTAEEVREMLAAIGVDSVDDLFDVIPADLQLQRTLDIPPGMSELELTQHMRQLAAKNLHAGSAACFLGGGSYDHFVPSVVDAIAARGEFYTSYTPYQPEVSQGNLQAMFEYQTMICQLTGMDVSNASLYDGGSATIEAVMMAVGATRRRKVVVPASLNPEYREIMATYLVNLNVEIVTVGGESGAVALAELEELIDGETACVVLQHPNFFGCYEDVAGAVELAHRNGALMVQVFDPISLGLLKNPGELGVDIAVAEGQSLGTPMLYGGPYLGVMACREKFMRRLPGRIAGQTIDRRERRCWVLTLQTREQHIVREKATSNICTNQGLFALRAAVYLATVGPQGLREIASLCVQKTEYARRQLTADRFDIAFDRPTFKEFVVRDQCGQVPELLRRLRNHNILGGVDLGRGSPEFENCFLVAVTEKRSRQEIDQWAACLQGAPCESAIHA